MPPGESYNLVQELAKALKAEGQPPVKSGVAYRILAFKVSNSDKWAVAMIPLKLADPSTLFNQVNKSYEHFLIYGSTDDGVLFFEDTKPAQLIETVTNWYNEETDQPPTSQSRQSNNRGI